MVQNPIHASEPSPLTSVGKTADSATTDGLTLTLGLAADANHNPDSSIVVTPTCGSNDETEKTCNEEVSCPLTGLNVPGCLYTFNAVYRCQGDNPTAQNSDPSTGTFCIGKLLFVSLPFGSPKT